MRMWKIATIASLLVAPAAFGGVAIRLDDANVDGNGNNQSALVPVNGTIVVQVWLDINPPIANMADGVGGVSLFMVADKPAAVKTTARVRNASSKVMANLISTNAEIVAAPLSLVGGRDAGGYDNAYDPDEGTGGPAQTTERLMNFTFQVLSADYPITISVGKVVLSKDDASAIPLDTGASKLSYVITPEPASMMLLAAGAAFFARRRRAA